MKDKRELFIEKAIKIHGSKYDYCHVDYIDAKTKVCIICPVHGEFWQTPSGHLSGKGCKRCSDERLSIMHKYTKELFIEKAKSVHGNKYDYSKVEYVDSKTKVYIICPKHGEFLQEPSSHLNGCGCPECAVENNSLKTKYTTEEFLQKVKSIHGDKYDYSKVIYNGCDEKVTVVCPKHGEFKIRARNLINGIGCRMCGLEKRAESRLSTTEDFIEKARTIHGSKYDYSKVEYIDAKTKVCIICPEHGEFWQTPNDHLSNAHGCRICGNNLSNKENDIVNTIKSWGVNVEQGNRKLLSGKEIDILLPDYNIGIEYDGLKWHSEEFGKDKYYHLSKTDECNKIGIRLIHIFEDEYVLHKEIVLSKLKHILKLDNGFRINARDCTVSEIKMGDAMDFLNKNHIQGFAKATIYLGCFYKGKLIGVMTFLEESTSFWNLNRFATDISYVCRGIGSKILSYFKKRYKWINIKSFADRRWVTDESNNLYIKLGFKLDKILKPDYRYSNGNSAIGRIHKFNFRKQILSKKYGLPLSLTEKEMTEKIGYYRVWDCGLYRYALVNDC